MIILRNKKFSLKKEQSDLDKTSKKYLAGSAGLAGLGGYLVKTSNTPVKIKTDEELKSEGLKIFDRLQNREINNVGRHALVGAAGLTAAAGYRYYRNKKKKAKKSISEKTYSIRNKKLPDSRIGIG